MTPTLKQFILGNFIDGNGHIPAVLGRDASEIVTPDRQLKDAALSLLVLVETEEKELTTRLLSTLQEFEDHEFIGFHELLDVTSVPNIVGQVRTPSAQALAAWASYRAAKQLNDHTLAVNSREYLRTLFVLMSKNGWPSRFMRDGSTVLSSSSSLSESAVVILAADETAEDTDEWRELFNAAALHLSRFVSIETEGVWAMLSPNGEPDRPYGHRLRSSALGALAWCALHKRGDNYAIDYAQQALLYVHKFHPHFGAHGFWDRTDSSSQVRVDPLAAYHGQADSPFPAKLMADHALVVLAADKVAALTDNPEIFLLAEEARLELDNYTDPGTGGIYQGQGSWFSTPVDPTVPLARHVMVSPHTAGAFSVGNTAYVPFHEKHAETQFLALKAQGLDRSPISFASFPSTSLEAWPLKKDITQITTGRITDGLIDLPAYLHWLRSTASGLSYGLTPYRSPLGLRSDRSAQTFSVIHVISDLLVLREPIPDQQGLLASVFATQNHDGGFGEQPGLLSEAFTTYCAVLTAKILGNEGYDRKQCIDFLNACQHPRGGFGNAPGYPCDAWHSNLAVLALHALDQRPPRENDFIAYLIACRNPDGGYGNQPGSPSDTFATFRVISALLALELRPPQMEDTISWLRGLQTTTGGFRYRESGAESFVGSYHAIAALYIMGAQPANIQACKQFIAVRQSRDGGFSRIPGGPSETTDEGFIAIQALHMLEQKLNPYWAIIIT